VISIRQPQVFTGGDMASAIHAALHGVPDLRTPSAERDELWLALWEHTTTRTSCEVIALGSGTSVRGSSAESSAELIAAWEWLLANEAAARAMPPTDLGRTLRGVATRSHRGSARAAMADSMGGLTHVPVGVRIELCSDDILEFRAS
jgi:hypothetical protein